MIGLVAAYDNALTINLINKFKPVEYAMRFCEICAGRDFYFIHRQNFLFPGRRERLYYDVVACRACGFAFAVDIPDQSLLNEFYQDAEHHLHLDVPAKLEQIYDDFFLFVKEQVAFSEDLRVLDIGSGVGHFLSRFKVSNVHDLRGIEPSLSAAKLARERYGIDVWTGTLDAFPEERPFGLVSLCGVLEHIADLDAAVQRVAELVAEDGILFVAVPDAAAFGTDLPTEAFLEFALEHINFFSATSLDNLLRKAGFEKVNVTSQYNDFYHNYYLLAVYRKTVNDSAVWVRDYVSATSLRRYVALSKQRLRPLEHILEELRVSGESVVVWGAGSLTSRLFCDTCLGQLKLAGIIDRNPQLHGKVLQGVEISAPESIVEHTDVVVLIASTTYSSEIRQSLANKYGWRGPVVSLGSEDIDR